MKRSLLSAVILLAAVALPLSAQEHGVAAPCHRVEVPERPRQVCLTVAQAVQSAQPQLGILLAGGNPTLGSASAGGLRLGILPRVSASARGNLVLVRLPEILAEQAGATFQRLNESTGVPAPALSLTASAGVFHGLSVAPMIGGIGAVDLLGTASWIPLRTFDIGGFQEGTDDFSFGLGARLGVLRESFILPGASISLMRHRVSRLAYGEVCASPVAGVQDTDSGYTLRAGFCGAPGDPGEFAFDLTNWSTRAVVSKRLLGFGLTGGVGRDSYTSDIEFGFRSPPGRIPGQENFYVQARDLEVDNTRWSYFVNGSFTALVATLALEAGWMQGGDPVSGFDTSVSDFDPGRGTLFGSLGLRVAF